MKEVYIVAGTMRDQAAARLVEQANAHQESHRARFWDIWMTADPGDGVDEVLANYHEAATLFHEKHAGKTNAEIWREEGL